MRRHLWLWIRTLNIVKMAIFPQIDLQIPHIPYQNPGSLLAEIGKLILKMHMEIQGTQRS